MKMLQEDNGTPSSMRIAMLLCVITGCTVAILGTWKGQDAVGLGVLVAGLIAPVTAGKVMQKGAEK